MAKRVKSNTNYQLKKLGNALGKRKEKVFSSFLDDYISRNFKKGGKSNVKEN